MILTHAGSRLNQAHQAATGWSEAILAVISVNVGPDELSTIDIYVLCRQGNFFEIQIEIGTDHNTLNARVYLKAGDHVLVHTLVLIPVIFLLVYHSDAKMGQFLFEALLADDEDAGRLPIDKSFLFYNLWHVHISQVNCRQIACGVRLVHW